MTNTASSAQSYFRSGQRGVYVGHLSPISACMSSGGKIRYIEYRRTRSDEWVFVFVWVCVCHVTILGLIHFPHQPAIRHAPARCLCAACSRYHVCCCPRGCRSHRPLYIFHRRSHVARSPFHSETLSSTTNVCLYAYTPLFFSPRRFKPHSWNSSPKTGQNAGLPQKQLRRPPSAARHSHTSASGRSKNHHRMWP